MMKFENTFSIFFFFSFPLVKFVCNSNEIKKSKQMRIGLYSLLINIELYLLQLNDYFAVCSHIQYEINRCIIMLKFDEILLEQKTFQRFQFGDSIHSANWCGKKSSIRISFRLYAIKNGKLFEFHLHLLFI